MKRFFIFLAIFFLPTLHAMGDSGHINNSSHRISVQALLNPLTAPPILAPVPTHEPAQASAADEVPTAIVLNSWRTRQRISLPSTIIDLFKPIELAQIPARRLAAVVSIIQEAAAAASPYRFRCSQCFETFNSEAQIRAHQIDNHRTLDSHCQCGYCFKEILVNNVRAHQRRFHRRCFVCLLCNQRFDSRPRAIDHLCIEAPIWRNEPHQP